MTNREQKKRLTFFSYRSHTSGYSVLINANSLDLSFVLGYV